MAKRIIAFFGTLFDIAMELIFVPQALYFITKESYDSGRMVNLPAYVCLAVLLFSSYSFIRITETYNQPLRESFWENNVGSTLKSRLLFVVEQTEFWIKVLIIALIYILAPLNWTLKPLAVVTNSVTNTDKLLCLAGLLPVLFVLAVFANLSACKRWGKNKNPTAYSQKEFNHELLSASIAYCGGAVAFVFLLPILLSFFMLIYRALTVGRIIAIAVLILSIFAYRVLRAVFKRRGFLRSLKKMCAEKGYKLSQIQYPYISLFVFLKDESFNITIGEKVYSCKLVSARKRKVPIAISAGGHLTFIHIISIRGAILHQYTKTYKFDYESENTKVLIVNPVPKKVYEVRGEKMAEIDNGAVMGGYKFFAATGFLRAAELNVLDR